MRSRAGWFAPTLLLLACLAAYAQPGPPTAAPPLCEAPPQIDGALDDACWDSAWTSEQFHEFSLGEARFAPNQDTTVRLVTDGSWLYLGATCLHPTPDDMKASITENFGGRVFGDECIKLFIRPGFEGGGHLRYVLNFRNVYTLRRSFEEAATTPNLAWPSATQVTDAGWTAEVAVPLFNLAGYADLSDFRMNVFRKKLLKEYDQQHVEVGFNEFISTWSATDEWLNPAEMGRIVWPEQMQITSPFVANARNVAVSDLREADGEMVYDVTMTLMAMTASAGRATVEVIETPLEGETRRVSASFELAPMQVTPASVTVPVEAPGERSIEVVVRDAASGMPFQTTQISDTSSFELLRAFARRSYYTSEDSAGVVYSVGMPAERLADRRLTVRDEDGHELARLDAPDPEGELPLTLERVEEGRQTLSLTLEGADGRALSAVEFEVAKLPPGPGSEWEIDRLTGSLLRNGEPFFPFGFLTGYDDAQFAEIAAAGCNTIVWWMGPRDVPMADVVSLADKHGLQIMLRPQKVESRADEMETLKRHFEGEEYERAVYACRSMLRMKSFLLGPLAGRLSRVERNEISREYFELHMPAILENVRSVREMPNVLGYDTLDEPVFSTADQYADLRRMYLKVREIDPYHPMFALYSSRIPAGPEATSFADCLGTDPYWTPGRELPRGSINWMSTTTATTVHRAREVGQHPWTVPESALWSDVIKRMVSPQEQICQSYLALIHGTKALLYFTHGWVALQSQWEAFETLAHRVDELAPALTAAKPPQQISYAPGTWAPLKGEVPDVQARVIRYPDGRNVLLAANVRLSPVEVAISVEGMADGPLRDVFDGEIGQVEDGAFSDTLQARGVRTYDLGQIGGDAPVRIGVEITPLGDESVIEEGYRHQGRIGMRNIMPNGSFEQDTVEGWPDYFWPYHSTGTRTGWPNRVGSETPCMTLMSGDAFHGERFLRLHAREAEAMTGVFLRTMAPQHDVATPYVLSFYARTAGDEPGEVLVKAYGRTRPAMTVEGDQWQRFEVQLEVPPRAERHSFGLIYSGDPVDIDAVQYEQGFDATEFQP